MISTQEYIQRFSPSTHDVSRLEKFAQWIHNHSLLVKITRVALDAMGACAIAGAFAWGSIIVGAIGLTAILLTEVAFRKLAAYGILKNSMSYHAYKAGQCEGGRLFYQGDVPILSIESDDPYKAGKAQGYLTAPQALALARRARIMSGMPEPTQVQHALAKIKEQVPGEYLTEMKGLVDGINRYIDEQWWWSRSSKITLDEVLLVHLMPDSLYLNLRGVEGAARQIPQVACTVTIGKNKNSGLVFGRNMDWPSFGLAGTYTLVVNRKHKGRKQSTVEIGIPGFVGTLTGMNGSGFSVAMNVCARGYHNKGGIPAAFYNRKILENCRTVGEGNAFTSRHEPLGSYHLSLADPHQAQSIHFYQGKWGHVTRKLARGKPLITTNCSYGHWERYLPMHASEQRQEILEKYYNGAKEQIRPGEKELEALIAHGLKLPYVNNVITTHAVEMIPGQKRMRVAFDNSYAASQPLQEVDTSGLF